MTGRRSSRPVSTLRVVGVARAIWGSGLLLRPGSVLTAVHRAPLDTVDLTVARILGARHVGQAAATVAVPAPEVVAAGVYADLAHALSMVGLAAAVRSRRRAGLTEATIAVAFALGGWMSAPSTAADAARSEGTAGTVGRLLAAAPGGRMVLNSVRVRP